ncbi:MAG: S41 family peptidase [Chloroflexi bacterium]|nr:MAG: S41 family peptidase [Chloroflexota bacterium]
MNESDYHQPPRTNRKLVFIVAIAGVVLCVGTAVAGYAIGRATATPQAAAVPTPTEEFAPITESIVAEEAEEVVDVGDVVIEPEVNDEEAVAAPVAPTAVPTDPPQQLEPETPAEPLDLENLDLAIFDEVWGLVDGEFYGDLPSNDALVYGAIEGSLETLDDEYTRFVPPDVAALLREDYGGAVEGIGAFVNENDDGLVEIVAPIEGQPAELVGLLPGDIILEVDGQSVIGEGFYEVIAKVRGPRGTEVVLTIGRPSTQETLEFTITRARFEVPIVEAEMLPDNIAYVQLNEFSANSSEQLLTAVSELLDQNPSGMIFDLRNNPGGLLAQSVQVADLFLEEGVVLYQRDNQGGEREFTAVSGQLAESIPLVVLVNDASASASEIVAGAIQDNQRGTLIGVTTFGKGSVQLLHELSDGSELRVTIARWYTPNDNSINKLGITPDIEVLQDFESEDDEQLQRAVEFLINGE